MRPLLLLAMLLLLIPAAAPLTNLDFRLNMEDRLYLPSNPIPFNVSLINRDTAFSAKNGTLTLTLGERTYDLAVSDLTSGDAFEKDILLPQFPPGTYTLHAIFNYTGLFGERFVEESYASFEVIYPPIQRYPRNVYVSSYDLPEKLFGGKSYPVLVTVTNDGEVAADLVIEVASLEEFFSKEAHVNAGESITVSLDIKFENPGVSLIEARAYAVIDGKRYLLNYRGKTAYVQEERKAKLSVETIAPSDGDELTVNDKAEIIIALRNNGYVASSVVATLSSPVGGIDIIEQLVDYGVLPSESVSTPQDGFQAEIGDIEPGDYNLKLAVSYEDSEKRSVEFEVPLKIASCERETLSNPYCQGNDVVVDVTSANCKTAPETQTTCSGRCKDGACLDRCESDADCPLDQACKNSRCTSITCPCGAINDHMCHSFECCSDAECNHFKSCNAQVHACVWKTGCQPLLRSGEPKDKLDLLFIGAEYQDYAELKAEVDNLLGSSGKSGHLGFFDVEPFRSNAHKFNVWLLPSSDFPVPVRPDCSQSCPISEGNLKAASLQRLCPFADSTAVLFRAAQFRSCALGDVQWNSLSCQPGEGGGRLLLHEAGHAIGGLADEYEEPRRGSRPWGPNCAGTLLEAQKLWGDLVGVYGTDFYPGCSYTQDNYRPTFNSIMRSHYTSDSYGPVNERALLKVLEGYR